MMMKYAKSLMLHRVEFVILACLHLASCAKTASTEPTLTAEEARHALIVWVAESDDYVLQMALDFLQKESIVKSDNDSVSISAFKINLKTRTFVVTVNGNEGFAEYSGDFVYDRASNRWRAIVVAVTQT